MRKSVNTIFQNAEGKFLLQMRDGTSGICNPLCWNFFGGGFDQEDPISAAIRESGEEIGVNLRKEDLELLGEIAEEDGGAGLFKQKCHTVA